MLCGIWLLLLGVLVNATPAAENAYVAFIFLFWSGHRLSTVYLAYSSPAYRPLLSTQRGRFLGVPLAIALGVVAFLFAPQALIPYPIASRVFFLMGCDFFFNLHHFALQHYGVLSIYRMRAGQDPSSQTKVFEKAYCLWIGGVFVALGEVFQGAFLFEEQLVTPFVARETLAGLLGTAQVVGCLLIAAATVGLVVAESRGARPSLPKTLYVLSLALLSACSFLLRFDAFIALWTIQHWIVAIGITGHMAENDARRSPATSGWYRLWSWPNRRFATAVLLLVAVSVLSMPFLEIEAGDATEQYGGWLFPGLAATLNTQPWVEVCVALGFATAFVHYRMDRAVYRFSDAETRECSLPLLMDRPPVRAKG